MTEEDLDVERVRIANVREYMVFASYDRRGGKRKHENTFLMPNSPIIQVICVKRL